MFVAVYTVAIESLYKIEWNHNILRKYKPSQDSSLSMLGQATRTIYKKIEVAKIGYSSFFFVQYITNQ